MVSTCVLSHVNRKGWKNYLFSQKNKTVIIKFHHLLLQKLLFFTWHVEIQLLSYKNSILIFVPFSKVVMAFPLKDIWSGWELKREA